MSKEEISEQSRKEPQITLSLSDDEYLYQIESTAANKAGENEFAAGSGGLACTTKEPQNFCLSDFAFDFPLE